MIKLKRTMFFREEDTGGGSGGGAAGLAAFDAPGDATPPEPTPTGVEGTPIVVAPQSGGSFDPKKLAQEFGEQLKPMFADLKRGQEAPPTPLTPEEAKKLLKVWEPGDDFVAKFGNMETQKQAFVEMRDALVAQLDTLSQFRLQNLQKEVEGKFNPAVDFITRHEAEQREARFNKKYEALAKPELRPLLTAVAKGLAESGVQHPNEDAAFDALAKATEAVIKQSSPTFSLSGGSTPPSQQGNRQNNGIPVTTPGSGGGGGQQGGGGTPAKRGLAIFAPTGK